LTHVGTFIEAVGQGRDRFGSLHRCAVGKLSGGSGSKGDDGSVDLVDSKLSSPAVVENLDWSKAILGVLPPLQDGFAIEGNFATSFVKKYLAAQIAQDGNGEEIVDEARGSMC
jgi:hypothetical protein